MQSKTPINAVAPFSTNTENDKSFLEKNGIPDLMRDVLGKLLERQPVDSLGFMADYFQSIDTRCLTIEDAERHLLLSDYKSPVFILHVKSAYDVLIQLNKARRESTNAGLSGAVGDDVNKLVFILLKDSEKRDFLIPKLKLKSYSVIACDVLKSIVISCLVFKDYMLSAQELYQEVKDLADGRPNQYIASTILEELCKIMKQDVACCTEQSLRSAICKLSAKKYTATDHVTEDQFLSDAAQLFVSQVQPLR